MAKAVWQAKGRAPSAVTLAAVALAGMIGFGAPLLAEEKGTHDHDHTHSHDHAHGGGEKLSAEVQEKLKQFASGYFDDSDVAPRPLADWEGEWRSVYPLLQSGKLDPVWEHKAEKGDKTAAGYRAYYETGYRGTVGKIDIKGDQIRFEGEGGAVSGTYASDGFEILTYEKGNRGVRFIFKKTAGDAGAPGFIQFSDHIIAPQKADHYHLYAGDDRAALLEEMENWPTYYPASLSDDEILTEMLAH